MTGALDAAIASSMVPSLTWLRSTSMLSRLSSWHHRDTEGRQAVMLRIVGGAVGPVDRLAVGEREIAHAQRRIKRAARKNLSSIWPPPSAPIIEAILPALCAATHVGGGARGGEVGGIAADDRLDEVDLLERLLDLLRARLVGPDIDRPELPADQARAQPLDVGIERVMVELAQVHGPSAGRRRGRRASRPSHYARRSAASPPVSCAGAAGWDRPGRAARHGHRRRGPEGRGASDAASASERRFMRALKQVFAPLKTGKNRPDAAFLCAAQRIATDLGRMAHLDAQIVAVGHDRI